MKKAIVVLIAIILLISLLMAGIAEEAAPHFIYTQCTDEWVYGIVELPDDGRIYYVRMIFYLPHDTFVALTVTVEGKTFNARVSCPVAYITMELVDEIGVFGSGQWVFDVLTIKR